LVIAGMVAAVLTLGQSFSGSLGAWERPGGGLSGTANNTAALLVTISPFALYLVSAKEGRLWASLGLLYVLLAILATLATLSRAGLILLAIAMLGGSSAILKRRTMHIQVVLAVGLALLLLTPSLPLNALSERAQTIGPAIAHVFGAEPLGDVTDAEISARGSIYRVGFAVFRDHPFLGVGSNQFGRYYLLYQYLVSGGLRIIHFEISPHSAYLSFLVELGLAGLLLWLSILWAAWRGLSLARSKLAKVGNELLMVDAVTWAFLLLVIYGLASNVQYEKLLWLLLGLSAALPTLSQSLRGQQGTPHESKVDITLSSPAGNR
jgi:O-antigen ligase